MKKTFYHNFLPSKAEEEACKANNTQFQTTRELIEIKDVYPPPLRDHRNPWKIKKTLIEHEVVTGKLVISSMDTFDHIFRYWTLDTASHVVLGHRMSVILWDVSNQNNPKKYCSDSIFFDTLPNDDDYVLACMAVFKDQSLRVGDGIGLYLDLRSSTFQFEGLRKDI